ncbi:MAG: ferrochelatase, partial [Bacteriovoracaceae bacterium]
MYRKTKVILVQLGSPKSLSTKDVRSYLKEFLGDPRVVDINPTIWKIILYLFVLPFRPKKSAKAYSRIYENGKFPLIENTKNFAHSIKGRLDQNIELNYAFVLSAPTIEDTLAAWEKEDPRERARRILLLPQFPQYSESTSASVFDRASGKLEKNVNIPSINFVSSYHKLRAFIDLSAAKIQKTLETSSPDALLISFHGIPLRRVLEKKDEYYFQCFETFCLLKERLDFPDDKIHMVFQSRFGSEQWLGPATDEFALELVEKGDKKLACYCPSFVVDCLETTDEIGNELREDVEKAGGSLDFIECLNDDEAWAAGYADYINALSNGSTSELERLFYQTD